MTNTATNFGKTASIVEGDIRDATALSGCFFGQTFDAVIHIAAFAGVRSSIENPLLYTDVNVSGTVQMLECMRESGT